MVTLNLDCWEAVFEYLETETRTLYYCLLVSKTFFHLVTPLLYRDPLKVFEGQREFSPFSTHKLATLLEICSGLITPEGASAALKEKQLQSQEQQQQRTLPRQPQPSSLSLSTNISPPVNNGCHVCLSPTHCLQIVDQLITLPTTINYYKLVKVYPKTATARQGSEQWQDRLIYFAETIPVLSIDSGNLDFILSMVSKFRSLHTLQVYPSPKSPSTLPINIDTGDYIFGSEVVEKMVQFIQSHGLLFPGVLKNLNGNYEWSTWTELVMVSNAMGGLENQKITLKRDFEQDLGFLVVSRLKTLTLNCYDEFDGIEIKVMTFLKQCRALETLEIRWSNRATLDWSLLQDHQDNNNELGRQENKETRVLSVVGLKHLVFWGNSPMVVEAMKVFSKTLESFKIRCSGKYIFAHSFLDWKGLFKMPRLKSIELERYSLHRENLSCCPVLETLMLSSSRMNRAPSGFWSLGRTMISVTLRKLDLTETSATGFDSLLLKPLLNLEFLQLFGGSDVASGQRNFHLVDMSNDWYFPKLEHVALSGRFVVQIQGQILWIAPRLEFLSLNLQIAGFRCPLDTDTFLYPPWELDLDQVQQIENEHVEGDMMAITATTPLLLPTMTTTTTTRTVSTASFPALKHFFGNSFHTPKFESSEAFGNAFFGPRAIDDDNRENDHYENNFLFPNLQQLWLHWDQIEMTKYYQPMALIAARNLPRLELLRYVRHNLAMRLELLDKSVEPVLQTELQGHHPNFRNRPLIILREGKEDEREGTEGRIGKEKNRSVVIAFDTSPTTKYQLKKALPIE